LNLGKDLGKDLIKEIKGDGCFCEFDCLIEMAFHHEDGLLYRDVSYSCQIFVMLFKSLPQGHGMLVMARVCGSADRCQCCFWKQNLPGQGAGIGSVILNIGPVRFEQGLSIGSVGWLPPFAPAPANQNASKTIKLIPATMPRMWPDLLSLPATQIKN
jgi:hypothetical protein